MGNKVNLSDSEYGMDVVQIFLRWLLEHDHEFNILS